MSEETSVAFPVKWDISNVGAKKFYDRCKDFVETEDDFYELTKTSPFYHSINGVAIVFIIIVNIVLFYNFNSYIFKRQCRLYYFYLFIGSLIITFDSYFLGVYFEKYTCYVHHLLSGIGYALYFWSIVFIIIKYYKYYYVSQVAYIKNFLEFTENENKDKLLNKKYLFKPFYTSVTTSSALKGLACYVAFNMALSTVLRYTNDAIGSKGFCVGGPIYFTQLMSILLFLIVFLPLSLYEALKFDDKFRMKKTIIIFIVLHIIYYTGYMIESAGPKLGCSKIVQYAPPGFFVLLSIITTTIGITLSMVNDIVHVNKCNKNLKATYKGMLEMLEDRVQFREFGEFCRNENCVENILFYQEYWKYKRLFNRNVKSVIDPSRSQDALETTTSISVNISKTTGINDTNNVSKGNGINETNISKAGGVNDNGDRVSSIMNSTINSNGSSKINKMELAALESIEKESRKFAETFIGSKAIYEINIQHYMVTGIIDKLDTLQFDDRPTDEKIEEYYCLFDGAYKEVTNNIYLNSYSNYVHQKNKNKTSGKDKRNSQVSSMC